VTRSSFWLDLLAGIAAIVAVVGACIAFHPIGADFRAIYALTAILFFLAGFATGRGFAASLWWKAARLSAGGLLGIATLIMNNGVHRLPVTLGLIPLTIAVSAAGVLTRRDLSAAPGRSLLLAGTTTVFAALVIVVVVPGLSRSSAFETVDRAAPLFHLAVDGPAVIGPADLRGRVTILAFWASWCLPCIRELPELERTYDRFRNDPRVTFYAVDTALLGDQTPENGRHFLEIHHLHLPMAFDTGDASRALGVDALPALFIVGPDGHIRCVHHGYDVSEDMEEAVADRVTQLVKTVPRSPLTRRAARPPGPPA